MQSAKAIVIGGSAGSVPVLISIIDSLHVDFRIPVIIIIHRQRNVRSEMAEVLSKGKNKKKIIEPCDKEAIADGAIYLAPQNYHLLIEADKTFSLDYSESVHYSRPSIDVTFESAAVVFRDQLVGILLSGANNDGTIGVQEIVNYNGTAIIQDPVTAEYPAMPQHAIKQSKSVLVMNPAGIISFLNNL